mgnify:FL=1
MRKKVRILALTLISIFLLTACGSVRTDYNGYSEQDIQSVIQKTAGQLQALSADEARQYQNYYSKNTKEENAAVYAEMFKNWAENRDQAGDFQDYGKFTLSKSGKTLTATQILKYSKRDLKLTYVMKAKTMEGTSINIEQVYGLGETMGKAGLNVLMGMGTVFFMLILISILISLFKFIPGSGASVKKPLIDEFLEEDEDEGEDADDLELVAIVSAAIAASTGSSTDDFVVRSIKRRY